MDNVKMVLVFVHKDGMEDIVLYVSKLIFSYSLIQIFNLIKKKKLQLQTSWTFETKILLNNINEQNRKLII